MQLLNKYNMHNLILEALVVMECQLVNDIREIMKMMELLKFGASSERIGG